MPAGWQLHAETVGHQMVWNREMPADDRELPAVWLDASHVPQMLELVKTDGKEVGDDELVQSEVILPPRDISFEEARAEFSGEGLIPD